MEWSFCSGLFKCWQHENEASLAPCFLWKVIVALWPFMCPKWNMWIAYIVYSNLLLLCMRILVLGRHGLFQTLCQVSATWFSFRFISKNKIKWKKIKTVTKIHSWKSTKWKQNENKWKQKQNKQNKKNEKKTIKLKKEIICQFSATVQVD